MTLTDPSPFLYSTFQITELFVYTLLYASILFIFLFILAKLKVIQL